MSTQEQALRVLRDQIDQIDQQIQTLLNERARCAQQVAEVKQHFQGAGTAVFYRPEREAQVLRQVIERNQGPLPGKEVARIIREIMSACLALEKPMQVAFLGPEGAFTQQAALKHFGHSVQSLPMGSLDQVFRAVEAGDAHYGVVPIESSSEGISHHALDLFRQFNLRICGELELHTHYQLLAREDADIQNLQIIYANQGAFTQCRSWLEAHLPDVRHQTVTTNADAAQKAATDPQAAAIAGELATDLYGLYVLGRNIEDQPGSCTRFLIIGNQEVGPSGDDKTSILLSAENEPGTLYKLLEPFHRHRISLTRIETRPSGQAGWNYLFYIDFEGHMAEQRVADVIAELQENSAELKLLGSYPKAVL